MVKLHTTIFISLIALILGAGGAYFALKDRSAPAIIPGEQDTTGHTFTSTDGFTLTYTNPLVAGPCQNPSGGSQEYRFYQLCLTYPREEISSVRINRVSAYAAGIPSCTDINTPIGTRVIGGDEFSAYQVDRGGLGTLWSGEYFRKPLGEGRGCLELGWTYSVATADIGDPAEGTWVPQLGPNDNLQEIEAALKAAVYSYKRK